MHYPNIFQTSILVLLLIITHWLLKRIIPPLDQENLRELLMSVIKVIILTGGLYILSKQEKINKKNFTIKPLNSSLLFISIAMGVLIVFNPLIVSISLFSQDQVNNIVTSIADKPVDVFVFLNLVVFIPIFEELLFRGLILSGLKNSYNIIIALIISSVIFGLFHVDILGAFIFGLWLGWIYLKTNNILLCVLVHSACNAISFIFRAFMNDFSASGLFVRIGENFIIISLLMFGASIGLLLMGYKKIKITHNN